MNRYYIILAASALPLSAELPKSFEEAKQLLSNTVKNIQKTPGYQSYVQPAVGYSSMLISDAQKLSPFQKHTAACSILTAATTLSFVNAFKKPSSLLATPLAAFGALYAGFNAKQASKQEIEACIQESNDKKQYSKDLFGAVKDLQDKQNKFIEKATKTTALITAASFIPSGKGLFGKFMSKTAKGALLFTAVNTATDGNAYSRIEPYIDNAKTAANDLYKKFVEKK